MQKPIEIGTDNRGARIMGENGCMKEQTKHIIINFVRDHIKKGTIRLLDTQQIAW